MYLNNTQVLELATKLHEPHFRKDGKPYITHPIAVAKLVEEFCKKKYISTICNILIQASYLHDVLEDCEGIDANYLSSAGVDPEVVEICQVLNKKNYKSYKEYINSIAYIKPAIVKFFDITHNLSDLQPGHKRDKYELAKSLLENKFSIFR